MALTDLREAGCDILTLGQYFAAHAQAFAGGGVYFATRFEAYGERARAMGFVHVASGPMVRSSYHADDFKV